MRLRAERKAGQLLKETEEAKGGEQYHGQPTGNVAQPVPTLTDLGISKGQSSRWQQLANVPEAQFEAALAAPEKPSTTGIISQHKSAQEPMDPRALWLWGRLRDFEREGILDDSFAHLVSEMTEGMQADTHHLAVIEAAL
jgi:hypothetical protein